MRKFWGGGGDAPGARCVKLRGRSRIPGGGANPPGGDVNLRFYQKFPKKCTKLRKFWGGGGCAGSVPLRSVTEIPCFFTIGGSRGGRPARAPPFAWHPSSLADLGGHARRMPPPFAWHPSF